MDHWGWSRYFTKNDTTEFKGKTEAAALRKSAENYKWPENP